MHGSQGGVVFRVGAELFFLPATVAERATKPSVTARNSAISAAENTSGTTIKPSRS